MKQLVQNLQNGATILVETPIPQIKKNHVLIKTHCSLVSSGTEKMLLDFGKANLVAKAMQQPEKVREVWQKIKIDGLKATFTSVTNKLSEPIALGYCNAGEVVAVGEGVTEFRIGDRVVSNGAHAEIVCVSKNLVAKIPLNLPYEQAVFTVIGAIGLQGIRLINPQFDETIVVIGLGLIGQLTAELLKANGCRVIAFDVDPNKVDLAISKGIEAFSTHEKNYSVQIVKALTHHVGVDGVLITASNKSDEIMAHAAQMCRKRGRIVLIGVVGLQLQRADFYEKELSFQVSCSYGAGRYDENYEKNGQDYPIAYVRFTAKRNFEAVLQALINKQLAVESLITQSVTLADYQQVYAQLGQPQTLAFLLKYTTNIDLNETKIILKNIPYNSTGAIIGIIGAGNFTKHTMLPILLKNKVNLKYISSISGLSSAFVAQKYGILYATTNNDDIVSDPEVNAVMITTQHHTHATLCIQALQANKHVFIEKPLAITSEELNQLISVYQQHNTTVTVGFNRRFSVFSQEAKKQLGNSNLPMNIVATMNAGMIPTNHWTQNMEIGGGRIIGEACHLIDLITFLTGSLVMSVVMNAMGKNPDLTTDNASILLKYENGSTGVINYFANGNKSYAKERIEIHSQGRSIVMDNFRKSTYYGFKTSGFSGVQDKGHVNQFNLFLAKLSKGGEAIIPFEEIVNTTKASIAAVESLKLGLWVNI